VLGLLTTKKKASGCKREKIVVTENREDEKSRRRERERGRERERERERESVSEVREQDRRE
jgi:hypothetical protein